MPTQYNSEEILMTTNSSAYVRLAAMALMGSMASGCATITKGSTDTITVDTSPSGATCRVTQDGQTVAIINPTPGSMVVPKSKNDLAVDCEKEGYTRAAGNLSSEFEAMTFGNILFGGVIGVAVDAASGALNQYPPMITLTLAPQSFRGLDERDRFYDRLRDDFEREYEATVARIKTRCGEPEACERQLRLAEEGRSRQLNRIESDRLAARVS